MSRRKFNKGKLKASVRGWQDYSHSDETENVRRGHKNSRVKEPDVIDEPVAIEGCGEANEPEIGYRKARIIDGVPYLRENFGYSERGGGLKTGRWQSTHHD